MVALALILAVGCAILFQFCNRKLIHQELASTLISIMYVLCAATTAILAWWFDTVRLHWVIVLLGVVNGVGAWSFFRALSHGMAKTILFLPLTRVVSLICAAVFLGEWVFFDPRKISGIIILMGTVATLSAGLFFSKKQANPGVAGSWHWYLIAFVVTTGLLDFLTKYFANSGVSIFHFLFSWYTGAFVGSFIPRLIEKNTTVRVKPEQWKWYLGLAGGTLGSLGGIYWGLQLAPATLIFPVHAFAYAAGSLLMGLFLFNEHDHFGKSEWFGIVLGTIGTIFIITGIF